MTFEPRTMTLEEAQHRNHCGWFVPSTDVEERFVPVINNPCRLAQGHNLVQPGAVNATIVFKAVEDCIDAR